MPKFKKLLALVPCVQGSFAIFTAKGVNLTSYAKNTPLEPVNSSMNCFAVFFEVFLGASKLIFHDVPTFLFHMLFTAMMLLYNDGKRELVLPMLFVKSIVTVQRLSDGGEK